MYNINVIVLPWQCHQKLLEKTKTTLVVYTMSEWHHIFARIAKAFTEPTTIFGFRLQDLDWENWDVSDISVTRRRIAASGSTRINETRDLLVQWSFLSKKQIEKWQILMDIIYFVNGSKCSFRSHFRKPQQCTVRIMCRFSRCLVDNENWIELKQHNNHTKLILLFSIKMMGRILLTLKMVVILERMQFSWGRSEYCKDH